MAGARRLDALSVVLPRVCVRCNTGWMKQLEDRTAPVLGPMLLDPPLPVVLDPARQATLATWAVKTSLLLGHGNFTHQQGGWVPADNLTWLHLHGRFDQPPPGAIREEGRSRSAATFPNAARAYRRIFAPGGRRISRRG